MVTSRKPFFFLPQFFLLHFFHLCSQSLGIVHVMFSSFLCCLDFGVWIIKLKFSPFSLLFSSPFLIFTLFFSLLLFSFEPLVLLLLHHLNVPCVASSCYLIALPCCLIVALPCCLVALPCHVALLFHNVILSCYLIVILHYFVALLHCLIAIAPQIPSTPPIFCFVASLPCCLVTSLPCVGWYFPPPSSFVGRSLELRKVNFPTTTSKSLFFLGVQFFFVCFFC